MNVKDSVLTTEMIYFNTAGLDPVTYNVINNYGFEGACFILRIINDSDSTVIISYDGIHDHEYISTYDHITLNFQTNNATLVKWTKLYARGIAGKFGGNIYVTGYYQSLERE